MEIIRVFPRKTRATPTDTRVAINREPFFFEQADEIHISVVFTYDIPQAERLAKAWEHVAPVKIGGPATGMIGNGFIPGMYLKDGYTITSRGCPNRCWFCSVWKRDGDTRELPIKAGWNILDDNILACSNDHINKVFDMLSFQRRGTVEFTGGLEAKRLKPWHVKRLKDLNPKQFFFAYDTEDDLEPLIDAANMLHAGGFKSHPHSHAMRAYVLCGYPDDTMEKAQSRMEKTIEIGFTPMAMLWRNEQGITDHEWRKWQRTWVRPAIIYKS